MSSLPPLPRPPLAVESPLPSPPPCRRLACCLLAASFTRDEDSTPLISMTRWIALLTTRVVIHPNLTEVSYLNRTKYYHKSTHNIIEST